MKMELHKIMQHEKKQLATLVRLLLYIGVIAQISYILFTPFLEISSFILFSTSLFLIASFIDLSIAKKELEVEKSEMELTWELKRRNLQKFYMQDKNVDDSFSECLTNMLDEETHNERISKILENYQENNQKFKIKLNRKPENRLNEYLQD